MNLPKIPIGCTHFFGIICKKPETNELRIITDYSIIAWVSFSDKVRKYDSELETENTTHFPFWRKSDTEYILKMPSSFSKDAKASDVLTVQYFLKIEDSENAGEYIYSLIKESTYQFDLLSIKSELP